MAFDKNQLMIHQLQVKSQRLEDGLRRLIELCECNGFQGIDDEDRYDYYYALGCLGGEFLKKKLFATPFFEQVVLELKEKKFMKAETADKNIEAWHEKNDSASQKETFEERDLLNLESETVSPNELGMKEITIVAVPSSDNPEKEVKESDVRQIRDLGTRDEEGNIVPRESKTSCEYADPVPCENKYGGRQKFGDNGSSGLQRRVIECY